MKLTVTHMQAEGSVLELSDFTRSILSQTVTTEQVAPVPVDPVPLVERAVVEEPRAVEAATEPERVGVVEGGRTLAVVPPSAVEPVQAPEPVDHAADLEPFPMSAHPTEGYLDWESIPAAVLRWSMGGDTAHIRRAVGGQQVLCSSAGIGARLPDLPPRKHADVCGNCNRQILTYHQNSRTA